MTNPKPTGDPRVRFVEALAAVCAKRDFERALALAKTRPGADRGDVTSEKSRRPGDPTDAR